MSHRKSNPTHILEAAQQFDAQLFLESIKEAFADFPEHRFHKHRVLYPTWYLF